MDSRAALALTYILQYGGIDGEHHKAWVLDQVVRALTGEHYAPFVAHVQGDYDEEEEEFEYSYDEGIAP